MSSSLFLALFLLSGRCAQAQSNGQPAQAPGLALAQAQELLINAGLVPEDDPLGVRSAGVLLLSPAQDMGLRPDDRIAYINGRKILEPADAQAALSRWMPYTRLSIVVERSLSVQELSTTLPAAEFPQVRTISTLTPYEKGFMSAHLASADKDVPERLAQQRVPVAKISSDDKFWMRLPKGLSPNLAVGDVVQGVVSTSMAADSTLDFIAVGAGSQVWAQILSVAQTPSGNRVKLQVYKIHLKNGHVYPFSGIATVESISALHDFQVSMLKPLIINEADSFYMAGPGLWLKTSIDSREKFFTVTYVIPDRSASAAGLKVGDEIESIDGTSSSRLNFSSAIDRLYGPIGSSLRVRLRRGKGLSSESMTLLRGVIYRKGIGVAFSRAEGFPVVAKVYQDSSAQNAGIKEGDTLLRIGAWDLRQVDDEKLSQLLTGNLNKGNELVYQRPGRTSQKASLISGLYPVPIEPGSTLPQP